MTFRLSIACKAVKHIPQLGRCRPEIRPVGQPQRRWVHRCTL